jgi:membrane protease YdiL (CAAX protease family)
MNSYDDNPSAHPEPEPENEAQANEPGSAHVPTGQGFPQANDPGFVSPPLLATRTYPADLQITWSWPHLVVFAVFGFISLFVVQSIMVAYLAPRGLSAQKLQAYFLSNPKFAIASMLIWYGMLFFFLYVTLSLLRGHSFWECLGWRKIQPKAGELPRNPFLYFAAGCGLSLFVAIASSQMKTPENMPIEEMFKYRQTALLFMAMAVLVAPLVEETLFRGYLYPLIARSFGVGPGIIATGILFGLMHGAQLGWTWALVGMLVFVGIVFTIVRARTGSVLASYLMHLGYNSLISAFAILGTQGFTKVPPHH